MKNKYATGSRKRFALRQFMYKVEAWLPTKTFNKLQDKARLREVTDSNFASTLLFGVVNNEPFSRLGIPQGVPAIRDEYNEEVVSKFIVSTLRSGIHIDDLVMNCLDCGLSYGDIFNAVNVLMTDHYIKIGKDLIVRFQIETGIKKKNALANFKGEKVKVKEDKPKPIPLVKKLKRRIV